MTEEKGSLTGFYGRAKEETWHQQQRESHRRWRRRMLGIGSAVAAALVVTVFVIYDYPRESGLTDALGLTCGEYVLIGDPESVENPMDEWEVHREEVAEADDVDGEGFLAAVQVLAAEIEAEPLMGHFFEVITQRAVSATVAGDDMMIGHHEEFWSATDRVSVFNVAAQEITWTAELDHPVRDENLVGEDRPRVLYGVGATDALVVLQTPTYRGDTDLVISDKGSGQATECVRLQGAVDTAEVLTSPEDEARAWSQTINLNAGKISANEFLIHHGLQHDSTQHTLSRVDVTTGEAHRAKTPEPRAETEEIDISKEAQESVSQELQRLTPVGESHYLLTWEAGYLLFTAE